MKWIRTIFVVLLSANLCSLQDLSVAKAIAEIIEEFILPRSISFDFIVYRCLHLGLVNEVSKLVQAKAKVLNLKDGIFISQSAILFFNDTPQFIEFYRKSSIGIEFPKELHFFVYIENFRLDQFNHLFFDYLHPIFILKQSNFVARTNNDFIELTTFTMFEQPHCRQVNLKTINRYSVVSKEWANRSFAIEKFKNFNGCELKIVGHFIGNDVLRIFEYSLNFTTKLISQEERFMGIDIILAVTPMRLVRTNEHTGEILRFLSQTHHVSISHQVCVASRPALYSFLEKALLPFDNEVWYWLIGILALAVLVIVFISFTSQKIQKFVFGSKVKAPFLNLM
jgi:hypothetical protein